MEMYAIDVGPQDRTGVPVTGRHLEFDADRDDVEWAIQRLYSPGKIIRRTGAQPTEELPYTYVQPRRPMGASGDLESEFGRQVDKYESFKEAPGTTRQGGFFFRTGAPITADQLRKTGALPHGIDSRTWALVNTAYNYQGGPGLPEFAIVNTSRRRVMELKQGEGEQAGKTLLTFHRPGKRSIEVHEHGTLSGALEETLRFVSEGEKAEYLPLEYVDTALSQFEEERENPDRSPQEEAEPSGPPQEEGLEEIMKRQLPVAEGWQEAEYLAPDGTPLSLSGPDGPRDIRVPGRHVPGWISEDRSSAAMLAAMEGGFIRVEAGRGLRLRMHREPTSGQKEWIRGAIQSAPAPGEVEVYVQRPGEPPTESGRARFGPRPEKALGFIDRFYSEEGSRKAAQVGRSPPAATLSEAMAEAHRTWDPSAPGGPDLLATNVKWIMPGGQAIGPAGEHPDLHHNHFELPEGFGADQGSSEGAGGQDVGSESEPMEVLLKNGAVKTEMQPERADQRRRIRLTATRPLSPDQNGTLRALARESRAEEIAADLTDSRSEAPRGRMVRSKSVGDLLAETRRFYETRGEGAAGRANPERDPSDEDAAYVLAVGDAQDARLEGHEPESQRLVTMRPDRYLEHAARFFAAVPVFAEEISVEDRGVSAERVEEMAGRMRERKPLDAAWFDVLHEEALEREEDREHVITAQEGRHRALAARRLGIEHMPVILFVHRLAESQFEGLVPRFAREDGKEIPDIIEAGATPIDWPEEPTATKELWREAKFGAPV